MGGALIKSLVSRGFSPKSIACHDIDRANLEKAASLGAIPVKSAVEVVRASNIVFICVKPKDMEKTLSEISTLVKEQVIVSIAAGKKIGFLKKRLGERKIVRLMPNIAALAGESMNVFCAENLETGEKEEVSILLGLCGPTIEMDERHFDSVTAISGSGPAFVALFAEALAQAGEKAGLEKGNAMELAKQTILGTAKLLKGMEMEPMEVVAMVSSPGGTTVEGIKALEQHGFRQAITAAVEAARKRSEEMGKNG